MTYWDFFVAGLFIAGGMVGAMVATIGIVVLTALAWVTAFDLNGDTTPWWGRCLAGIYLILLLVSLVSLAAWSNQ